MPREITVTSVLNKTKRRDPWFLDEYTINPYSGCSFNCLYCYIRGSRYGEHMEERVSVKTNVLELLDKQLSGRVKKGQYGFIVLGSATDAYLHFEKELQLSRKVLELILKHRFPVHVITKSDLITRDLDLLHSIDKQAILPRDLHDKLSHGTIISFSFSTLDSEVARVFEPGAPDPAQRLSALQNVLADGFHAGVSMMPLLPYISDTTESLQRMFSSFRDVGARYLFPSSLTLFGTGPADSRTLVFRAIQQHYPHLLEKYNRLFAAGSQLPVYYREAFDKKMKELSASYGLSNSIITE